MEKGKIEGSSANAKTKWEDPTRQPSKPWHSYISDDLPRSFMESADAAIRSACSLHHDSSTRLRFMQVLLLAGFGPISYISPGFYMHCISGRFLPFPQI